MNTVSVLPLHKLVFNRSLFNTCYQNLDRGCNSSLLLKSGAEWISADFAPHIVEFPVTSRQRTVRQGYLFILYK